MQTDRPHPVKCHLWSPFHIGPVLWLIGFGFVLICLYHVIRLAVRSALSDHHNALERAATDAKPRVP